MLSVKVKKCFFKITNLSKYLAVNFSYLMPEKNNAI